MKIRCTMFGHYFINGKGRRINSVISTKAMPRGIILCKRCNKDWADR